MIDEHDDHEHDGEGFQPNPEDIQLAHAKGEQLAELAQKLGLYQQHFDLGVAKGPDGSMRMTVISTFSTGDITFSDRILHPQEADLNDEFIVMRTALEEEEFEEYRARLAREMGGEGDEPADG